MHYARWERHGDPLILAGVPRVASPKYFTKHSRIKRIRGSASQHLCGGCCGSQARHWATIHGRDGRDIFLDFVPLCARCHSRYDWPPEGRTQGSANGNAKLTEAQVAEIKAALRAGQTITSIARASGTPAPTIGSIKNGRSWRHVS